MHIEIIGAESLGVRGLCCLVVTPDRRVLVDPGVALGFVRHGHMPHPVPVAMGRTVRARIIAARETATDIVFSHFHGDHIPLAEANPYQLAIRDLPPEIATRRAWCPSPDGLSTAMSARYEALAALFGANLRIAEGSEHGEISFSPPVPHGEPDGRQGTVMMTRIRSRGQAFVHASDIQLLNDEAVDRILDWRPDTVLAAGPPMYLKRLDAAARDRAWYSAVRLLKNVPTVILDHHIMRSSNGLTWLRSLSERTGRRAYSAAGYMGRPPLLLEARREELYDAMPVPEGWHDLYGAGQTDVRSFLESRGAVV